MWVQLLAIRQIETLGKTKTYHPGDWVDVGKQTALRWCADGTARVADVRVLAEGLADCGVVTEDEIVRDAVKKTLPALEVVTPDASIPLPFPKTLILQRVTLRPALIAVGFRLLERWEMAVPLWDYDELAVHVGTSEEREATKAVVRDLRVPLYHPDVLFARRCPATREVMEELAAGDGDARLRLLRSVYRVKPLICALPVTWVKAL